MRLRDRSDESNDKSPMNGRFGEWLESEGELVYTHNESSYSSAQ